METRRLDLFVRIADAGSISRAASQLGMAQPSLSQQLAILERELKAKLVIRSASGISLTSAGTVLYDRARALLRQVDDLQAGMAHAIEVPSGRVSIGLMQMHSLSIGAELVRRIRRDSPYIRLQVVEGFTRDLLDQVESGMIDLALVGGRPADSSRLATEALFEEDPAIIQRADWPGPPADLEQLSRLPWISRSPRLAAMFAHAGLTPNVVAEIRTLPLLLRAVADGLGIALLHTQYFVETPVDGIKAWPLTSDSRRAQISLCFHPDSVTPAARLVADVVRDVTAPRREKADHCPHR